jgi:hypothetical protein
MTVSLLLTGPIGQWLLDFIALCKPTFVRIFSDFATKFAEMSLDAATELRFDITDGKGAPFIAGGRSRAAVSGQGLRFRRVNDSKVRIFQPRYDSREAKSGDFRSRLSPDGFPSAKSVSVGCHCSLMEFGPSFTDEARLNFRDAAGDLFPAIFARFLSPFDCSVCFASCRDRSFLAGNGSVDLAAALLCSFLQSFLSIGFEAVRVFIFVGVGNQRDEDILRKVLRPVNILKIDCVFDEGAAILHVSEPSLRHSAVHWMSPLVSDRFPISGGSNDRRCIAVHQRATFCSLALAWAELFCRLWKRAFGCCQSLTVLLMDAQTIGILKDAGDRLLSGAVALAELMSSDCRTWCGLYSTKCVAYVCEQSRYDLCRLFLPGWSQGLLIDGRLVGIWPDALLSPRKQHRLLHTRKSVVVQPVAVIDLFRLAGGSLRDFEIEGSRVVRYRGSCRSVVVSKNIEVFGRKCFFGLHLESIKFENDSQLTRIDESCFRIVH